MEEKRCKMHPGLVSTGELRPFVGLFQVLIYFFEMAYF